MITLLPCPFCGAEIQFDMDDTSCSLIGHQTDCWLASADDSWGVCGIDAKNYVARKKHIAEVWNRRAGDDKLCPNYVRVRQTFSGAPILHLCKTEGHRMVDAGKDP